MSTLSPHPPSFTSAAFAVSLFGARFVDVGVRFIECMTVLTMCSFGNEYLRMLFRRHWNKMIWINTQRILAYMVHVQSFRDWTNKQFISIPIRLLGFCRSLRKNKMTIPFCLGSSPNPAIRGLIHIAPKTFFRRAESRRGKWIAVAFPTHVMFTTPPPTNTKVIAAVNGTSISGHLQIIYHASPTDKAY